MEIDKVFSSDVDGVADNLFSAVKNSVSEIKAMQQRKAAENVQLVIQALKKIESDLQDKFDGVTTVIEKRVATIKDGRDGLDGRNGRDGKDGRPGRDGAPGARGPAGVPGTNGRDGEDGVSVTDAKIDFDGSLIISLSSGREINVGEVVAPDLAEKIKVITNGGGTSQSVLDTLASLQAQITAISNFGYVNYVGTWNANTNSPTITSGSGDKGDYYVVSVAGSTSIDGQTLWGVGDWIIFNGVVWQKVDGGSTGDFTNISVNTMATFTYLDDDKAVFTNSSAELVSKAVTGTGNVVLSASPTLTGTASLAALTTSSTVTHNGGTANGVAYLNGSKVLTTGSALTFDGTNFVVGGTAVFGKSTIINSLSGTAAAIGISDNATTTMYANNVSSGVSGLWSSGALAFGTNNGTFTEQMRLTSTGLGIGTTSPGTKLEVSVADATNAQRWIATTGRLRLRPYVDATSGAIFESTNTAENAYLPLSLYGSSVRLGNGAQVIIDSSGNLGIGSSSISPAYGYSKIIEVAGNFPGIKFAPSGASTFGFQIGAGTGGFQFYDVTAGSERARIDSSGNLLVGQTSGSNKLSVTTSGTSLAALVGAEYSQVNIIGGSQNFYIQNYNSVSIIGTKGASPLVIATNEVERARITSGGNFGIGQSSPQTALGFANTATISWGTTNYPFISGDQPNNTLTFGTQATERARIDSSGNLLVGKTAANTTTAGNMITASYMSSAGTQDYWLAYNTSAAAYRFYVSAAGTISATSTTISAISDQRLKENVRDLDDGLDAIMALKPRKFDWKAGKGKDIKDDRGFVAQEFEQVFPDMIDEWKDPAPEGEEPYKSVRADLIPILVKAIQEQQAIINQLKARIEALEQA